MIKFIFNNSKYEKLRWPCIRMILVPIVWFAVGTFLIQSKVLDYTKSVELFKYFVVVMLLMTFALALYFSKVYSNVVTALEVISSQEEDRYYDELFSLKKIEEEHNQRPSELITREKDIRKNYQIYPYEIKRF